MRMRGYTGVWLLLGYYHTLQHFIVKGQVRLKLTLMKIGGSILVNNDNSYIYIPSALPQEPMICQFMGIIIYIDDYGEFPSTALFPVSKNSPSVQSYLQLLLMSWDD